MIAWFVEVTAETAVLAKLNVDYSVKIVSMQVDFSKNRRKLMKYHVYRVDKKNLLKFAVNIMKRMQFSVQLYNLPSHQQETILNTF